VLLETAALNATELSTFCSERGLFPERVERWQQPPQNAKETDVTPFVGSENMRKNGRSHAAAQAAAA